MYEAIFYQLYKIRQENKYLYTPVWKLIGEVFLKELEVWGFVSYEVSARLSELYKNNPGLFEREHTVGKSGSTYYQYRIRLEMSPEDIKEPKIISLYHVLNASWKKERSSGMLPLSVDNSIDENRALDTMKLL